MFDKARRAKVDAETLRLLHDALAPPEVEPRVEGVAKVRRLASQSRNLRSHVSRPRRSRSRAIRLSVAIVLGIGLGAGSAFAAGVPVPNPLRTIGAGLGATVSPPPPSKTEKPHGSQVHVGTTFGMPSHRRHTTIHASDHKSSRTSDDHPIVQSADHPVIHWHRVRAR